MKKIGVILFLYMMLAVLFLPLVVTILCGGFGRDLQQEAKVFYGSECEILWIDPKWIDFETAV